VRTAFKCRPEGQRWVQHEESVRHGKPDGDE